METWKDIKGYEGLYQVSSYGNIKSMPNRSNHKVEKIIKTTVHRKGYVKVRLCKEGKIKTCLVHRVVAEAFIPNPNNLLQVNHINEIKTDNNISNLEWCTPKYNAQYGNRSNWVKKKEIQYSLDGKLIKSYNSIREASDETSEHRECISSCCHKRQKTAGNFIWRFNGKENKIG